MADYEAGVEYSNPPGDGGGGGTGGAVDSVFGRAGHVVAQPNDYDVAEIEGLQTALDTKMTGAATSVDNAVARFDGVTGKIIQSSGLTIDDTGTITVPGDVVLSTAGALVDGVDLTALKATVDGMTGASGDVKGPAVSVDNTLPRYDGITGKLIQGSGVSVSDTNNVSGIVDLTLTGNVVLSTPGALVDGVDITALAATVGGIDTSNKVTGPATATDNAVARYNLTTGKLVQNSGVLIDDVNDVTGIRNLDVVGNISLSTAGATVDGVDVGALAVTVAGAVGSVNNKVTGPALAVDNTLPRYDGTTGKLVQGSSVVVDDSNNVSGVVGLTVSGSIVLSTPGSLVDGVDLTQLAANVAGAVDHVTGPAASVDNTLARYDGITGKLVKGSGVVVDDTNNVSGVAGLTVTGSIVLTTPGSTVDGVDLGALGPALATAVVGPASAGDNALARFDTTTGKLVQNSGILVDDLNNVTGANDLTVAGNVILSTPGALVDGVDITALAATVAAGSGGDVKGPALAVDNAVTRFDLATGKLIKSSGVSLDNTNNVTGVNNLTVAGNITLTTAGATVDGVDITALAATVAAGGTGAPADAAYLTLSANPTLTSERVLTAGTNVTFDTATPGVLTLNATGGPAAPLAAQYLTLAADATLTNERVLTAGTGIQVADAGAGGAYTLSHTGNGASVNIAGSTLLLGAGDAGLTMVLSNATSTAVTVQTFATAPLPIGTEIFLHQNLGAGPVTIAGAGGVTLRVPTGKSATISGVNGTVKLRHLTLNVWSLEGELTAAAGAVTGPASSVVSQIPRFSDTTGKTLAASTMTVDASGVATIPGGLTVTSGNITASSGNLTLTNGNMTMQTGSIIMNGAGATVDGVDLSTVAVGPASATSNAIAKFAGTTGKIVANSGVLIDGSNNVSGVLGLTLTGNITLSTAGATVDGVNLDNVAMRDFTINAQSGTAYTLVLADAGKIVELTNAAAVTVTIPNNATVAFPIGTTISFVQAGTSPVTIITVGDTLRIPGPVSTTRTQWSTVSIYKRAATEWVISGDLASS